MTTYSLEPTPIMENGDIVVGDSGDRRIDQLYLGKLAEAGGMRRLWLDISGEQVVAVLGKRGTGKSYTLGVLIEGLASGRGESQLAKLQTPRASLVLDIMDIFWTTQIGLSSVGPPELVKQHSHMTREGLSTGQLAVDVWIPSGFENEHLDPAGVRSLRVQASDLELDDWGALFEVDIYTEPRGMLIADVISHVAQQGYSRRDGERIGRVEKFGFQDLLACLDEDVDIANNYRSETIRSIRQRLTTLASLPLFAGPTTPLKELLHPFRASILMLGRLPDSLKKVLVSVLLRRLMRERRDASFAQKRLDLDSRLGEDEARGLTQLVEESVPRTWVLMDEAHVLAGADEPSGARDVLVKFAKEGRNYGLSLALATQQPSALDSRLMSQVETLIVHQLTAPHDASVATRNMRSPEPSVTRVDGKALDTQGLVRRLARGVAVFSCGNAPRLNRFCITSIRSRVTAHGGFEA